MLKTPSLSDKCRNIDMNKLIEMLDYLIDNIFIRVGNKVFRQTIGIPMGTDCAPLLANLFLFYYEYHYMKNLIRDNQCLAKSFNYTVRYIDDLLTFNNAKFETEITNIYPSELTFQTGMLCCPITLMMLPNSGQVHLLVSWNGAFLVNN